MDLAVGIINWNTKELLKKCLLSIDEYTKGLTFEIIVVDNNSVDGSIKMLQKEFPQARFFDNNSNVGFSKAVNQIIKTTNTDYVFVGNADIVLKENSFLKMTEYMKANPQVGVLGPKLINEKGIIELSFNKKCSGLWRCFFDYVFFYSYLRSKIFERYILKCLPYSFIKKLDITRPVAWVAGAGFLLRRSAAKEVGFMDERFFLYCEDEDFCCRINKAGLQVYYFPQTFLIHYRNKSIDRFEENLIMESTKSRLHFYRKRYKKAAIILVKSLFLYRLMVELLIFGFLYMLLEKKRAYIKKKFRDRIEVIEIFPSL